MLTAVQMWRASSNGMALLLLNPNLASHRLRAARRTNSLKHTPSSSAAFFMAKSSSGEKRTERTVTCLTAFDTSTVCQSHFHAAT